MSDCAIFSASYYIENNGFTHEDVPAFVERLYNVDGELNFCSIEALSKLLEAVNPRLIDRQSLSLEAALKIADEKGYFEGLNKSELSIIAGSYTSSIYPSAAFNLSTREKGPNFVNATEFTNTVGNAAVSRACIWNQFRGEAFAISEGVNSGLNAIVDAYKAIQRGKAEDILACATEEVGSAAVLIRKGAPKNSKIRPLAHIKAVDSSYIADDDNLEGYFNALARKFGVELNGAEVFLSGAPERLEAANKCSGLCGKVSIKKNLWSLAPLLDVGLCLNSYEHGEEKDCLIVSLDANGFVSSVLLEKGGR